ncbi:MAG: DUF4157 domain-containing protein [Bacteroidales bacterium]|nr:DUF4157 domain-containing protein [Bacteroidales bacterium]
MFAKDEEEHNVQQKSKDQELQMKSGLPNDSTKKGSPGTKTVMPKSVRSKMENSFGADFSGVNIHQNSEQASNIGALAYTQGNDIAFAPGEYQPETTKGQELLGHELTHVVQQRQGRVKKTKQGKGMLTNDNTSLEKEADEMGTKAAQGKMANVSGKGSGVQRKEDDKKEETIKASDVTITYASGVSSSKVKAHAITVIKEDAAKASIKNIKITSTYRSPENQMSAMYNNIESKGVEDQKILYGSKGDKVIDAYAESKKVKNATSATIQAAMLVKAKEIDFTSAHSKDNYESYNVIDISFKDFTDDEYKDFRKVLDDDSRISKVLGKEESDPCLHLEISIS